MEDCFSIPQFSGIAMAHIMFLLCFVLMAEISNAHDFSGMDRIKLKNILIKERADFDACIKKTMLDEEAIKLCRYNYAKQRTFSAEELFHFYTEHAVDAEEIYTDLYIAVSGNVDRVDKSGLGYPEIIFYLDPFGLTGVRCEFAQEMADELGQLEIGSLVTVGGISKKMFRDNYVSITHCEFLKVEQKKKSKISQGAK